MMKALIAMSGGVDSSVAAYLTRQSGYECIGCTMKLYTNEDAGLEKGKTCCSTDDTEDARSVAFQLDMPFYVFNFTDDFRKKVIGKFVSNYLHACTPNPCIDCNRYMKFDKLYQRAQELDCDKIVTGHYARIEEKDGNYILKKAVDPAKDQSYVLYNLTQELLAHVLFPLGGMSKTETRKIAEENGFINADKAESQDICFVPNGDYAEVIRNFIRSETDPCSSSEDGTDALSTLQPGDFVSADGTILGKHKGLIHYTIGQRRGLGISAPAPLYVCRLCPENNTVVLGSNDDLFSDTAEITDVNWISGQAPKEELCCAAKIRYRQKEQPAKIVPLENGNVKLIFDEAQRAITPGQAAVFYDGDVVLGGGTIL